MVLLHLIVIVNFVLAGQHVSVYSDETTKEIAKAVQEVAKTTATTIELSGKVGAFMARIIGGPIEEMSGMMYSPRK